MRVTRALSPFLLHRLPARTPALSGFACAALAVLAALSLSGCATKSELGEKPFAADELKNNTLPSNGAQTTTITPLQKFFWIFSPYRPVIQQGNFISQEMLGQLKVGMTRDQVRFVLGTPLLADMFHADRWDYPFRLAKGNGEVTSATVVVYFKDDKVDHFDGGNLPTEQEYIARIAGPASQAQKDAKAEAKIETTAPVNANPLPGGSNEPNATPAPIVVKPGGTGK